MLFFDFIENEIVKNRNPLEKYNSYKEYAVSDDECSAICIIKMAKT